jgi:hypothetical protein
VVKKNLSSDDVYAIINQMEVSMSMQAADLADLIATKKAEFEQRAYEGFKQKVLGATAKMTADLVFSTEIELDDNDVVALGRVTEGLRDLGYKFKFIEIRNTANETQKHILHISIQHLV